MERCIAELKTCLTPDTFVETILLADRVHHHGLHIACVKFASRKENRCALYI